MLVQILLVRKFEKFGIRLSCGEQIITLITLFSLLALWVRTRVNQRVSRAYSKKCDITANYSPQILIVHMYTAKKLALQANIFKISNVEYNKSVRTIFSASNHFLHWVSYMPLHFLNN